MNAKQDVYDLDRLWVRAAAPMHKALGTLALVVAHRVLGNPDVVDEDLESTRRALADVVGGTMTVADLVARRSALRAADAFGMVALKRFAAPWSKPDRARYLAHPRFDEMVADMVTREPRLEQSAQRVARLYSTTHAFAAAHAAEIQVTERVQSLISDSLAKGGTVAETSLEIQRAAKEIASNAEDWTRAYSETVFRTNANTAASAGRFAQVADPDVAAVIGAFRYAALHDDSTRPNHAAADGLIAAPDDPVWQRIAPPNGYRCRCSLDFVPWDELRARRLVGRDGKVRRAVLPSGAYPDPGFRHSGRPDIAMYLGLS